MKFRSKGAMPLLVLLTIALGLMAGCGSDSDSGTGPNLTAPATHYEMTLKMSSIWAQNDCENSPGNPGDFRYRLILRKPDESGNLQLVHDTGSQSVTAGDGDRMGVVMDPISFLVPSAPDASFQVEYWVGEYDPDVDFERHGWATHILDRGKDQMWAAGTSYEDDRYYENEDGSGSGVYKFAVWDTRPECSGAAYYYVTWAPVTPEVDTNNASTVSGPVTATISAFDANASASLLAGGSDPDGGPKGPALWTRTPR